MLGIYTIFLNITLQMIIYIHTYIHVFTHLQKQTIFFSGRFEGEPGGVGKAVRGCKEPHHRTAQQEPQVRTYIHHIHTYIHTYIDT